MLAALIFCHCCAYLVTMIFMHDLSVILTSLLDLSVCSSYQEGLGVWMVGQVPPCTLLLTTCVYLVHHKAECRRHSQDITDSSIPPWCSLSYRDRSVWIHSGSTTWKVQLYLWYFTVNQSITVKLHSVSLIWVFRSRLHYWSVTVVTVCQPQFTIYVYDYNKRQYRSVRLQNEVLWSFTQFHIMRCVY